MAAIHWAALKGNEACLRILLDKGADVDCLNGGLNSPLLLAAAYGHDTVARILIGENFIPNTSISKIYFIEMILIVLNQ